MLQPSSPQLPSVVAPVSVEQVGTLVEAAARRGDLPGLQSVSTGRFEVSDFGQPFETRLFGNARVEPGEPGTVRITFEPRMKSRGVWIFLGLMAATVWPGVVLTDSMIRTYFTSYSIPTWWWYVPLTAPFVPLSVRSAVQRSGRTGSREAAALVEKIARAVGGRVEPPPGEARGAAASASTA